MDDLKPPKAVLVVEDYILIAMETEEQLREMGCEEVCIAGNLAHALETIETKWFDLVLLDVNLGFDTSEEVARRLRSRGVPFALLTGFDEAIDDREAYRHAPILTKPYTKEELAALIRTMLAEKG